MTWLRLLGMAACGIGLVEAHKAWVRRHPDLYGI
jgi:hypothetical protein